MPRNMGLGIIGDRNTVFRMKFRWMFSISDVVGEELPMLPPLKSSRPSISIKEMEVKHLDETIYYPGAPEWKSINLTLYHIGCDNNPVFDWLKTIYDPTDREDAFKYGVITDNTRNQFIKREASCLLYDGCGETIERWTYDFAWPTDIDWGELNMESSDVVYIDLTLRYARAYVVKNN